MDCENGDGCSKGNKVIDVESDVGWELSKWWCLIIVLMLMFDKIVVV